VSEVLHRSGRGWSAVWTARIVPKVRLPGDTAETVRALHALNSVGLLEPNVYAASAWTRPCPRCGRATAVWRNIPPTVCTGCRAEYHRDRVREMGR
jgi:hypothetical protein